ncbi:MAG: tRNA (N6-isopentenyl adenosine(37)-C2)-methylthiotransferase MiaB [Acidobacteriota bacterium]|nr:tRNA (N6-isopentenyl adenosine(37)-C2)-methylthiotransferase MiaB [Acidobacteriota bacterium]
MLEGKKFFIHTFGCQMNLNDSEHVASLLSKSGASRTDSPENSDIILINTCAVREKSVEKLFSYLGRLKDQKLNKGSVLVCLGCVAQLYREKLLSKFPYLDLVVGPAKYQELPFLLSRPCLEPAVLSHWEKKWVELPISPEVRESQVSAYITIMEGCNNFCTFCVVPFTRGREKYRPLRAIIEEARQLAEAGYLEVQLLGQNVNSYLDPESGADLTVLLEKISDIEQIKWIRFLTSHPKNFSLEMARTMASLKKVCHQLHLPVQSGSNRLLASMNRNYSIEDYLQKIGWLKSLMPAISLSTDIIVGFPGETDDDFGQTMRLIEQVKYTNIFSFRYSPRPLTRAARLKDDVPEEVKIERLIRLQRRQKEIQLELNNKMIGQKQKVLGLGCSKKGNLFTGRNEGYQVVNFSSSQPVKPGLVEVKITGAGAYSLRGEVST